MPHNLFSRYFAFGLLISLLCYSTGNSQCPILGADLSYVNSILENGGAYRNEEGNMVDPYHFFSQRGCDMVRLRLWHTPENITDYCGQPITSNNLGDVLSAAEKSVNADMSIMLSIHYGDYFNDPGKQKMPAAWMGLNHETLLDSIYNYTFYVMEALYQQGSAPSIVSIGNETTWGFIDATSSTNGWQWPQDAEKFNTAFEAVDAFNSTHGLNIKKAVHFVESSAEWLAGLFDSKGITNYDIIGFSFYPSWSPDTDLDELGAMIKGLHKHYDKEVMVFETGFVWKVNGWVDSYNNILNDNGNVLGFPATPEGQKEYLLALAQTVQVNDGSGVFYWEPAYISSNLCTKWGQGSPYENVCFFDYRNDNSALAAFDFFGFCGDVGTNESMPSEIKIFPNPIRGNAAEIRTGIAVDHYLLYDIRGAIQLERMLEKPANTFTIEFDSIEEGLYFLTCFSSDKKQQMTLKIVL